MATTYAYGDAKLNANVKTLALATTLTASDSGKAFTLNAATGKAIVLPWHDEGHRRVVLAKRHEHLRVGLLQHPAEVAVIDRHQFLLQPKS